MDLDDYLDSIDLIDCTGSVTHRLTLLIDGFVRVRMGAVEAIVDPAHRAVSPPDRRLGRGEYGHDQVIDLAVTLARG